MRISEECLAPLLRYEYRDVVLSCRKTNEKHSCAEVIKKTHMLSLKELTSLKVTNLLTDGTDCNGVLCFRDKIRKLELPWNVAENVMSERCICFRPHEVAKACPRLVSSLVETDQLTSVSLCHHELHNESHINFQTFIGKSQFCIKMSDFIRLQKILKQEVWTSCLWHTYLITGESLTIAVDKYKGTARLYLLRQFGEMKELRQVILTNTVCELLATLSI